MTIMNVCSEAGLTSQSKNVYQQQMTYRICNVLIMYKFLSLVQVPLIKYQVHLNSYREPHCFSGAQSINTSYAKTYIVSS